MVESIALVTTICDYGVGSDMVGVYLRFLKTVSAYVSALPTLDRLLHSFIRILCMFAGILF